LHADRKGAWIFAPSHRNEVRVPDILSLPSYHGMWLVFADFTEGRGDPFPSMSI
jgi:hypothetical protein